MPGQTPNTIGQGFSLCIAAYVARRRQQLDTDAT